jgi:hypothetical protein
MAKQKTFSQKDLEQARQKLAELPDLSQEKMSAADVLQSLKDQIVDLCAKKGYTAPEIRQALADVGISVSVKDISELTASRKRQARTKPEPA